MQQWQNAFTAVKIDTNADNAVDEWKRKSAELGGKLFQYSEKQLQEASSLGSEVAHRIQIWKNEIEC